MFGTFYGFVVGSLVVSMILAVVVVIIALEMMRIQPLEKRTEKKKTTKK